MPDSESTTQLLTKWWEGEILGSPTWAWVAAGTVAVLLFLLLITVRSVMVSRLRGPAERSPGGALAVGFRFARTTSVLVLLVVAVEAGLQQLALSPKVAHTLRVVLAVALGLQAIVWGRQLVEVIIERVLAQKHGPDGKPDATVLSALTPIRFISMLVIASVVALIVLDNAGVNVTALVAGLGIGGLAVALAAQKILGDLFGAVTIVLDKPFVVGDFIVAGDQKGTVESIGMKTTRIRALSGEQLVFPNADLLASRIQNFQRMQERRISFGFGVTYDTPIEKLRRTDDIVKSAIERHPQARFDRCHFKTFGASSLDFECVYYVLSAEFSVYMDIQQAVNLEVLESLRREGVQFAFPTQTVYEYKMGPPVAQPKGA